MLPRDSEDVEGREVSRLAPRFHVELRADAPDKFRRAAFGGKHPGQKKQVARLHRLRIDAKRLERGRFIWPSPADGTVAITPAQLGYLLERIDWRLPQLAT